MSNDCLDIVILPAERCSSLCNDAAGWAELVEQLHRVSIAAFIGAREQHERNLEAQGLVSGCACAVSGGFTRHTAAVGASLQAGRCYARVGYSMR